MYKWMKNKKVNKGCCAQMDVMVLVNALTYKDEEGSLVNYSGYQIPFLSKTGVEIKTFKDVKEYMDFFELGNVDGFYI